MNISQATIAKRLGICRSTVSLALNNDPRITAAQRERVSAMARKLGYRPNRLARAMRTGHSGLIGIIQSETMSQLAAQRTCILTQTIHAHGYHPLLGDMLIDPVAGRAACAIMTEACVEGIVLVTPGLWFPEQEWSLLRQAGIPLVAIAGVPLPDVPHVRPGVRQEWRELTEHLLKVGRRRLVFCTRWWTDNHDPKKEWGLAMRIAGFKDALQAAGGRVLEIDWRDQACAPAPATAFDDGGGVPTGLVISASPYTALVENNCEESRELTGALLRAGLRPDAILNSNDERAWGALTALAEAGLRVPDDVAVTGYDGVPYTAYGSMPLTTVEQPLEAMARHSVDLLVRMIRGHHPTPEEMHVQLAGRLAIRASTVGIAAATRDKTAAPVTPANADVGKTL